ncbi:elongation factor P [Seleniivibrio woodruffii]|uniref:Elongation factor P n=1 Tax=Seleniivibrio woodruffii TaxID=1078050 RepID=A0A4R1KC17_9BACT|nr:elongation factor P [Seleniivibrio woodruffii]TCK62076.1 translation initiation factor 5A precursor (eIF-5A) /translation elongation factor P (EF-P) [Seleniivibrio woodruffii]TVZ34807.1 elongation factor P [Seleniivibrio woodruffii]
MSVITPNQFKRGAKIELDGEPYAVVEYLHIKCGRGGANVRTKVKSLRTGAVIERTFKSDEKIKQPDFEEKEMQYMYSDGEKFYFMDTQSYEQIEIGTDGVGDNYLFMPENIMVSVQIFNGQPIGIDLPNFVELEVTETDPGLKGDTVSGGSKPATVSTGGTVNVPLFINIGDVLKIDTREQIYMERVRTAR